MKQTLRVWDAPTRIFHWTLALSVVGLVVSANIGGMAMQWHFRFGYLVLSLLLFRVAWGLVGGYWSRFSSFIYRPSQIVSYLKGVGDPAHSVGHNPLGAFSVFALLSILFLQVGSGLFSDDEIAASGPLVKMVTGDWVATATYYHKEVGKFILLTLVGLHLAAMVFYRLKKGQNLVKPMLSGDKEVDFAAPSASDLPADRVRASVIFLVSCAVVWGLVSWAG